MASPVQRTTLLRLCLLVTIIATVLVGLIAMHSLRSDVFELSAPRQPHSTQRTAICATHLTVKPAVSTHLCRSR